MAYVMMIQGGWGETHWLSNWETWFMYRKCVVAVVGVQQWRWRGWSMRQVYLNLRHVWGLEHSVDFRLFFYLPHGRGIRVYESCRARGIANIRLVISPLIVCSSVPSPGPLILPYS